MTTSGAKLLRGPKEPRTNFLELFFDLVLVVALAQLSHGLIQDLRWSGAFQTLVLLLAMWWVWTMTAWTTDLYDPRRPAIQLLVTATMLGSLVMVVAVPDAFGERGLVFAGTYVAIQVGRQLVLVLALRGHEVQRRSVRPLFWFGVSAVPWIAGAAVHGAARGTLWHWRWPWTTRRSRSAGPCRGWVARPSRIWASGAVAGAPDPTRVGFSATYSHPIMVAGVVVTAVGVELVIDHPLGHPQPAWIAVILGGPEGCWLCLAAARHLAYRLVQPYLCPSENGRRLGVASLRGLVHLPPFKLVVVSVVVDLRLPRSGQRPGWESRTRPGGPCRTTGNAGTARSSSQC
ncbi:low temperature requirement protein A [Micromonospora sp. LZ34]